MRDRIPLVARPPVVQRCGPPVCWTGECASTVTIKAPRPLLFEAYDNIERMPEWLPLLRSVVLVDKPNRRSEWSLRVPRAISRIASAGGFGTLVCWEAKHQVEVPRRLWWNSLSGLENQGEIFFEESATEENVTTVTLRMTYSLPDAAAPLADNVIARRFANRMVNSAVERYRDVLEEEAAALLEAV